MLSAPPIPQGVDPFQSIPPTDGAASPIHAVAVASSSVYLGGFPRVRVKSAARRYASPQEVTMNALLGSKQITAASLLVLVADEDAAVRQYLADVDGRAGGGGGDEVRTTTTTTPTTSYSPSPPDPETPGSRELSLLTASWIPCGDTPSSIKDAAPRWVM